MKKKPVDDGENGFHEHGGYMAAKINKLEDQFAVLQKQLQKTKLFEGKIWREISSLIKFNLQAYQFSLMAEQIQPLMNLNE